MLATALHSPFITMALARKRLAFSTLKLVLRSSRYHRAARRCSCARERFAWVTLKYAPLLENALRSSSLVQSCNSLALIVALPCNSPHRPSSSLILSSIVRSSTLKLENFLHLLVHMLMLENALRSSSHCLQELCTHRSCHRCSRSQGSWAHHT